MNYTVVIIIQDTLFVSCLTLIGNFSTLAFVIAIYSDLVIERGNKVKG